DLRDAGADVGVEVGAVEHDDLTRSLGEEPLGHLHAGQAGHAVVEDHHVRDRWAVEVAPDLERRRAVRGLADETSLDHWDSMDDGQRRCAVRRAAANARRLQAMARDVLDTQALESGEVVTVTRPVELVGEVRDAVLAHQELDRDRTFELDVPDEPVWVEADADRLQQVLANLLDNARKNSPAVAPVRVAVRLADGGV